MLEGYEYILWLLLVVASITDLASGKIYNAITLPFILGGVLFRFFTLGSHSAGIALLAVGIAFAVGFPFWHLKAFAAGDVKLLMALGAWSNTELILKVGAFAVVVGAIVGTIVLLRARGLKGSAQSMMEHLKHSDSKRGLRIPFAPAFLCGFFLLKIAEMQNWSFV